MLKTPFLEFVRENALPSGNFTVSLPGSHSEIALAGESIVRGEQGRRIARDYIIDNVIQPLVNYSESIRFIDTAFTPDGFGGEGEYLPEILEKTGREYRLNATMNPINSFRNFWGGLCDEQPQLNSRGYVLFLIRDSDLDLATVFSHCYDPAVMAPNSLRKSLGQSVFKSIHTAIDDNSRATVIVLCDRGSLSRLVVFPGRDVFDKLLEKAIAATRTFDISMVDEGD